MISSMSVAANFIQLREEKVDLLFISDFDFFLHVIKIQPISSVYLLMSLISSKINMLKHLT